MPLPCPCLLGARRCCWPLSGSWTSGLSCVVLLVWCPSPAIAVSAAEVPGISSAGLFPTFLLLREADMRCVAHVPAVWEQDGLPGAVLRAALPAGDAGVLFCRQQGRFPVHTGALRDGVVGLFLSTTTVAPYFGSPLLVAPFEQTLNVPGRAVKQRALCSGTDPCTAAWASAAGPCVVGALPFRS